MSTAEIVTILSDLQEYVRIVEEASAAADALRDQIKSYMGDNEVLTAGPYRVTWKPVTTSRIDSKALSADHPDIAGQYTRITTTRRFTVK